MIPETIKLEELGQRINGQADLLIFSISYESRSSRIWRSLAAEPLCFLGFYNANHDYNKAPLAEAYEQLSNFDSVGLDSDAPLRSLDIIREALETRFGNSAGHRVLLDITCFTKEALALLVISLKHCLRAGSTVHCLYNTAADYGDCRGDFELKGWLSRGVVSIRSIPGFRGHVSLIKETHLILVPGFEVDRAHSIVDELQPNRLTIGVTGQSESIRPEFATVVNKMNNRLSNYYPERSIREFIFSSRDASFTSRAILEVSSDAENTIVACLNTKPAMMGVVLAALENPNIQLVYAQPAHYNVTCLSTPSDEALFFPIDIQKESSLCAS